MKKKLESEDTKKLAMSILGHPHPINPDEIDLTKDILTDEVVSKILGISRKTLSNLRKKGVISYGKIGSKTVYIRQLLLMDIIKSYND